MITVAINRLASRLRSDLAANATWCALVEADGSFHVLASSGLSDGVEVLHVGSTPCVQVVDRNGPVVVEDRLLEPQWAENQPAANDPRTVTWGSYIGLPMSDADGVVFGVVAATCDTARSWSNADVERIADAAAIATGLVTTQHEMLHQRRRLERERDARLVRREMYELARSTSSTDNQDQVAHALASGAGRVLDARLSVLALPSDHHIRFIHGKGVPAEVADRWVAVERDVPVPLVQCFETGEAIELTTPEAIAAWPLLAPEAELSGITSFFSFPIVDDDGEVVAALGIGLAAGGALTITQRLVIDELLADTAIALRRAGRATFVATIARELQRSLLPPSLPTIAGLDVYALYESSRNGTPIGGDWYDVVPISDTLTGLIVGDATGHDVRSAAMMGQVRHVVASQLRDHHSPAAALASSDDYFAGLHENVLATVVVMVVDVAAGTVVVSSAGHPPPIVIDDTGAHLVDLKPGAPVGAGFGGTSDTTVQFDATATLIAISDGVYERRGGDIDSQLQGLVSDIDAAKGDAGRLRKLLLHRVSDDTIDDATALVVTITPGQT